MIQKYIITTIDGNKFLSYQDIDGRWVATEGRNGKNYFVEGYVVSWIEV